MTRVIAILLTMTMIGGLTLALVAPAAPVAAQDDTDSGTCMTVVEHDAFRDNEDVVESLANGTAATSTVSNTRVTVEETDAFYRVRGENPNGYCVHFEAVVAERAMAPASIPGEVDSNDDNYSATWDAVHDWNTSQTYTRIEFTLPADTTASFAPNRFRVKALSWTSQQQSAADSMAKQLRESVFGKQPVTKRHYKISADEGEVPTTVTVRLQNPQTGEQISEYHAMYSTDGGDSWMPVKESTDAAVYKTEPSNRSVVRFHFTEPAQVKFVANPSVVDDAEHEVASYSAGIDQILDNYLGVLGGDNE